MGETGKENYGFVDGYGSKVNRLYHLLLKHNEEI
jgi:hypothetical protein